MDRKSENIKMIRALSDAYGVSGFEDQVIAEARRWIDREAYSVQEDAMRNLIIRPHGAKSGPTVLLDAHSDELGFMIQAIKPNGTMTFLPLGGWAANTVPAHKVKVQDRNGRYLSGVVAAKPVHFMSESERHSAQEITSMVIDVGSLSDIQTKEEFGIRIGAPVVPDVVCEYNPRPDLFIGKAMDCRIGVAAMLETLRRIQGRSLPVQVTASLSSQEEVGDRGIKTVMNQVSADIAIVFEGCPADDTFTESWLSQTVMGKGPMLRHMDRSIIANPRWMRYALNLAEERGIPVQESVRAGGGNNGAVVQLCERGIPTIVIGVPVRYIHSHHGICCYADFKAAADLAEALIETLSENDIRGF